MSTSIRSWLTELGLEQYADAFEDNELTFDDLSELDSSDLRNDLGIKRLLDRKKILRAIAQMSGPSEASLLAGMTTVGPPAIDSEPPASLDPGLDPLAGATRLESPVLGVDPLQGATLMEPPVKSRGLTIMGRAVASSEVDLDTLPAGAMFDDRYTIVTRLGVGGMGTVYQAVDSRVGQPIALKVLRKDVASQPQVVATLSREVALAQQLNHPNLLGIRHFEARGEAPYVVMELMDGGDLEEHLAAAGGRLELPEVLRVMEGLLAGLEALHAQRIAHLDIKPQNVLLGRGGAVKIADFGISSRLRDQRGGHMVAGTAEYAPPEQLAGQSCDVRADIYALGIMLHQLVTGRFPFAGRDADEARRWHESGAREFSGLSRPVAAVVAKACAVDRSDRFRTVADLRAALASVSTSSRATGEVVKPFDAADLRTILAERSGVTIDALNDAKWVSALGSEELLIAVEVGTEALLMQVAAACTQEDVLARLAKQPTTSIRLALAGNHATPGNVLKNIARSADAGVRETTVRNPSTPDYIVEFLVRDSHPEVRKSAAEAVKRRSEAARLGCALADLDQALQDEADKRRELQAAEARRQRELREAEARRQRELREAEERRQLELKQAAAKAARAAVVDHDPTEQVFEFDYEFEAEVGEYVMRGGLLGLGAKRVWESRMVKAAGQATFSMVNLPAGAFEMGSADTGEGRYADERPQHNVHLSRPFQLAKVPVTQALWLAVMGSNPSEFTGDEQRPVELVSWFDCVRFCNRLSEACGLSAVYSIGAGDEPEVRWDRDANGFRLPTEAEWELAARGGLGASYRYAGSNSIDEVAWYNNNSEAMTHPVGLLAANSWGLHDMSGNVWEWVYDRKGPYSAGDQVDPMGPSIVQQMLESHSRMANIRVRRGGSWERDPRFSRIALRDGSKPSERSDTVGFRIARTPR